MVTTKRLRPYFSRLAKKSLDEKTQTMLYYFQLHTGEDEKSKHSETAKRAPPVGTGTGKTAEDGL